MIGGKTNVVKLIYMYIAPAQEITRERERERGGGETVCLIGWFLNVLVNY